MEVSGIVTSAACADAIDVAEVSTKCHSIKARFKFFIVIVPVLVRRSPLKVAWPGSRPTQLYETRAEGVSYFGLIPGFNHESLIFGLTPGLES